MIERQARAPLDVAEVMEGRGPDVAAVESGEGRRYVALVSEVPGVEVRAVEGEAMAAPARARAERDHYATDVPLAVVAALLAASTFLPWYRGPSGFDVSVTGWASGSWGPLVLFLAAGSLALVALRRFGVKVSLPVEESLLHEGAGWLALVAAVVKSRFRPGPANFLGASYGVWVAIGAAALLIILAGRMSPHAPLVLRPGWMRGKAGVVGMVVLGVMVAGSAVFGVTNKPSLTAEGGPDVFPGTVRGRLPDCAKGFPVPRDVKPELGFGTGSTCQAQLTSSRSPTELAVAFRELLKSNRYTFTEVAGAPGSTVFTITKPRCATLAVVPGETGSVAAVAFSICATPTAPPRTPSPSPR